MNISWRTTAEIVGVLAVVVPVSISLVRSDSPPWEGQLQHNTSLLSLGNDVRSQILETIIEPLHSRVCEARRAGDAMLADSFAARLATYQAQHLHLTGATYPLEPCP